MPILYWRFAFLCSFYLASSLITAGADAPETPKEPAYIINFIENKGQWPEQVKFKAELISNGNVFITNQGFVYSYVSEVDTKRNHDSTHITKILPVDGFAYKVNFVNANKQIKYLTEDKKNYYHNYFIGRDSSRWKGHVDVYGKVILQNVYDGIDIAMYNKGTAFKYDFIIAPGADPTKIVLAYEGVSPAITPDGHLKIKTTVNEVTEQAPYAFQVINGKEVPVTCVYKLTNDNQLKYFLPEDYNRQFPLIIDPVLVFSTYSGATGNSNNLAYASCYDKNGNMYVSSLAVDIDFTFCCGPVTPGAFQTNIGMGRINKYNATGTQLIYSTYFTNVATAMIVNNQEELIIVGNIISNNNSTFDSLPITQNSFQRKFGGGDMDIYVTHFNKSGNALIGSTYLGGLLNDEVRDVALDTLGNIWLTGTSSSANFPVTLNAFQPLRTSLSHYNDAILVGFSSDCSKMLYSTYLGGNLHDFGQSLLINKAGDIVVFGTTESSDFPTTSGVLHTSAPSVDESSDAFVSIFSGNSGKLLRSTYIGSDKADCAYLLQIDINDNIYIVGGTMGNYPIAPGVFATENTDVFVDKLLPDLSASLTSTRLGNSQSYFPTHLPPGHTYNDVRFTITGFLVDNCEQVYVAGIYTDSNRHPFTSNAFASDHRRFWFGVFRPDFQDLLYSTYFGSKPPYDNNDHEHGGKHRFDHRGILYHSICSSVPTDYFPISPNAAFPVKLNTGSGVVPIVDNLAFKFAFQLSGVVSDFSLAPGQKDSGCAPYSVQFVNNSAMTDEYSWDFGDGSTLSHDENPVHIYTTPGTYKIALYAHNDTTCITDDTSYRTIHVFAPQVPDISISDTLICNAEKEVTLKVKVNNPSEHNRFLWSPHTGTFGPLNTDHLIIDPSKHTTYRITVWDTIPGICGYSTTDTIHINYKPRILDILNKDTLVCSGTEIPVTVSGTSGYTYRWSPPNGVFNPNDQSPVIIPNKSTIYTITASYPGCPDTAQKLEIEVDNRSLMHFLSEPDSICTGEAISFTLSSMDSTVNSLNWQFGDGREMNALNEEKIQHAYYVSGMMSVTLNTRFRACPDTSFTNIVNVYDLPKIYLGPDTSLCLNSSPFTLENKQALVDGIYHHLWSTGDTTETLKVRQPGAYSLTVVTEPLGCSSTESIIITKDCYIDIPNAFTPNDDGVNDYFFPRQLLSEHITQFKMQVFNRWGQIVFETTNTTGRGWDGRFNDKMQPQGIYVYVIDIEIESSRQEQYGGNVTLLR